jgi:hypothetical protein
MITKNADTTLAAFLSVCLKNSIKILNALRFLLTYPKKNIGIMASKQDEAKFVGNEFQSFKLSLILWCMA